MKLLMCLGFSLFIVIETSAQRAVYLKPTVGIQAVFSDITYGRSANSNLSKGWNPSDDYWGVLIQYNFIPKWRVSAGISESDIGWSYKLNGNRYMVGSGTYAPLIQFPLNIDYTLRNDIRIGRLDNSDYRYTMNRQVLCSFNGFFAQNLPVCSIFDDF